MAAGGGLHRGSQVARAGAAGWTAAESDLLTLTGAHPENPTLALPCREVLARGQKAITVIGPVPELREELLAPHRNFWT